jgi:hypothetical protein
MAREDVACVRVNLKGWRGPQRLTKPRFPRDDAIAVTTETSTGKYLPTAKVAHRYGRVKRTIDAIRDEKDNVDERDGIATCLEYGDRQSRADRESP